MIKRRNVEIYRVKNSTIEDAEGERGLSCLLWHGIGFIFKNNNNNNLAKYTCKHISYIKKKRKQAL